MRSFHGGGDPASANVFVFADMGEASGLSAAENIYCAPSAGAHRFGWLGMLIPFSEWVTASGTDSSSQALIDTDALCQGW
jgi:hypothetical protein